MANEPKEKSCSSVQPDLPPFSVVQRAMFESGYDVPDPDKEPAFPKAEAMKFASRMAVWGANIELDACEEWVEDSFGNDWGVELRVKRRLGSSENNALSYLNDIQEALIESGDSSLARKAQMVKNLIASAGSDKPEPTQSATNVSINVSGFDKKEFVKTIRNSIDKTLDSLSNRGKATEKNPPKAITRYAHDVPDAHMEVNNLIEAGAEVISVCAIPGNEVLKFAIFAKFDPDLVG